MMTPIKRFSFLVSRFSARPRRSVHGQRGTRNEKRLFVVALGCAACCALFTGAAAGQVGPSQFSARVAMQQEGAESVNGRMYVGATKLRFDMNSATKQATLMIDTGARMIYILIPQIKQYVEIRMDSGQQTPLTMSDIRPGDPVNPCAGWTICRREGTESVNGRSCEKWIFKNATTQRTAWLDTRTRIFVKSISPGRRIDLTDIREGPQPASVFAIPAGYQRMQPPAQQRPR